jgi:senataxin
LVFVVLNRCFCRLSPRILQIPLQHRVEHCVMVGDPMQLPATVFMTSQNSRVYERLLLFFSALRYLFLIPKFFPCRSLFERFQKSGYPVHLLEIQYRMHPEIRKFPSRQFYRSVLCLWLFWPVAIFQSLDL